MNKKVCVIVEGQLRGSENCGPTIKKYLVDFLDADLYFYVQNYEYHEDKNFDFYGDSIEKIVYDNPSPDFEDTFNKLCLSKKIDQNKWKENFHFFKSENYKLGYSSEKPGTCIRRMYNRHLIYEKFKDSHYEWFVILRSDMYFYKNFPNVSEFSSENLYTYKLGKHEGINNNLIVLNKTKMKEILNYIDLFLDGSLITYSMKNKTRRYLNEERFFQLTLKTSNTYNVDLDDISCFISGNLNDTFTTWEDLKRAENYVFKYEYDFTQFCENTNQTHLLKTVNHLCYQKKQNSINQTHLLKTINHLSSQKKQNSINQKKKFFRNYEYLIVDDEPHQKNSNAIVDNLSFAHKINNLNNKYKVNKKFIFSKNLDTNNNNVNNNINNYLYSEKKKLNTQIPNHISSNDKLIFKFLQNINI
jgi:hypothetical protein